MFNNNRLNETTSMQLNETINAGMSSPTREDPTDSIIKQLIEKQNKKKQDDLLAALLKQKQQEQM